MSVVGIDFGTASCVISQAKRGGIETVLNEASKRQTPALISFKDEHRFMGEQANTLVSSNFKNTVKHLKRLLGKSWSDPDVQDEIARLPNKNAFTQLDGDKIGIEVSFRDEDYTFTPEQLTAMLVGHLRSTAQLANDGRPVADIVFSCPAYWTNRQRQALLDACQISGVQLLGLINDGTAAALSYGIWKSASNQFSASDKEYVMFVDMGYSSFQVTIASYVQGKLEIVASAADAHLGGHDVDHILAKHFAQIFEKKHKMNPLTNPKSLIKLLVGCEKAKKELTPDGVNKSKCQIEYLMEEIDFASDLTLDDFEAMIDPLVDRVSKPIEEALKQSGLTPEQIHSVEIIGGAMRVRKFKRKVGEIMNLDPSKLNYGLMTTQNADECVSRGTALMSAMLSPAFRVKEFKVVDRVPYGVKLSWEQCDAAAGNNEDEESEEAVQTNGVNSVIVMETGSLAPQTKRVTYRRSEKFQLTATYEENAVGLLPNPKDAAIGEFIISGLPSVKDEIPRVRVDFTYDHSGMFKVDAAKYLQKVEEPAPAAAAESKESKDGEEKMDTSNDEGKKAETKSEDKSPAKTKKSFKPVSLKVASKFHGAMTADEIEKSSKQEDKFLDVDRLLKATSDKKNELEAYCYAMRDKLDGELNKYVKTSEREDFQSKLEAAQDWLYDEGDEAKFEDYANRLKDLQAVGSKMISRKEEDEDRPRVAQELRDSIASYLGVVNSVDAKYEHLTDDDREKVRKCCAEAESWLKTEMDKQADLNLYDDPVIMVADIETKKNDIRYCCKPIVTKKKPATPKKDPEAKAADEDTKMDDEGKQAGDDAEQNDGAGEQAEDGEGKAGDMELD